MDKYAFIEFKFNVNLIGSAKGKIQALKAAGASIANLPWDVPKIIQELT